MAYPWELPRPEEDPRAVPISIVHAAYLGLLRSARTGTAKLGSDTLDTPSATPAIGDVCRYRHRKKPSNKGRRVEETDSG